MYCSEGSLHHLHQLFSEEESLFPLGYQFGGIPELIAYFGIKANSFHSPTAQFHPVTALFWEEHLQWGSCRVLEGVIFGKGISLSLEISIGGGTFSLSIRFSHLHLVLFLSCCSNPPTPTFLRNCHFVCFAANPFRDSALLFPGVDILLPLFYLSHILIYLCIDTFMQ